MFENVKEYTISDYLMFKEDSLKGSEYGGEIEFDNGYGLSIVRHDMSYGGKMGLFEIMLTHNGGCTRLHLLQMMKILSMVSCQRVRWMN